MKTIKKLLNTIIVIMGGLFIVTVIMSVRYSREKKKERQEFEELSGSSSDVIYDASLWQSYKSENPDFAGWLRIDNTSVDYPVMHTPDNIEYYLRRSFSGSYSFSGTPFIGYGCDDNSDMFIIHSHNLTDGTMFGTLENYSNPEYLKRHPVISYLCENGERKYRIFAAVKTSVSPDEEDFFGYYDYRGKLDKLSYTLFVQWALDNSLVDAGTVPQYDQQLIVLSTCINNTDYGRFVVLGAIE